MARTGRPQKLDEIVSRRRDGTGVTIAQTITERIQLGMSIRSAAASAGIPAGTVHRWRLEGARLKALQAQGKLRRPGANQARLIDFCDGIDRAEAEAEAVRLGIVQSAAMGGATVTKTTVRTRAGQVVEQTTVTETLKADWHAAAWWLERRRPGYTPRVELTGADGAPLVPETDQAVALADSLRAYLEGRADALAESETAP